MFGIAIDGRHRGRGHGRAALEHVLAAARADGRLDKLVLHVAADNAARARACTAPLGFVDVGVHRRHYHAPDGWHDVAVMERFLVDAGVKTVVVLQPQFFPWRGVFEQIRLADEFVHLDDAQFQKGGFTNRVQLKTAERTAVADRAGAAPRQPAADRRGRDRLQERLAREAPAHVRDELRARAVRRARAEQIVADVYAERPRTIAELDIAALERCCAELGLRPAFTRALRDAGRRREDGPARRAARAARRDRATSPVWARWTT